MFNAQRHFGNYASTQVVDQKNNTLEIAKIRLTFIVSGGLRGYFTEETPDVLQYHPQAGFISKAIHPYDKGSFWQKQKLSSQSEQCAP